MRQDAEALLKLMSYVAYGEAMENIRKKSI